MSEFTVDTGILRSEAEGFRQYASSIANIHTQCHEVMQEMGQSIVMRINWSKLLRQCVSVKNCSVDMTSLSDVLEQACGFYEKWENNVKEKKFGMKENMHDAPARPDWGTAPNSISPVEYAWLCAAANGAAGNFDSPEGMLQSLFDNIAHLPEGHMLKCLNQDQFTAFHIGGVEGFVIRLDDDSCIVVFAGTDELTDGLVDAATVIGNAAGLPSAAMNPQVAIADNILNQLESQGFSNITITGHSLGGYLATEMTLRHNSVNECVVFDPMGHSQTEQVWADLFNSEQADKITAYKPYGGVVPLTGPSIGEEQWISVEYNTDAFFVNHSIDHIFDDAFGGMSAINELYD